MYIMNDYNKLKNLFKELGIGFREQNNVTNLYGDKNISIQKGDAKVEGYDDNVFYFYFDKYGQFTKVFIWE